MAETRKKDIAKDFIKENILNKELMKYNDLFCRK